MRNHKAQTTPGLMLGIGTIMFLFVIVSIFTLGQDIKLNEKKDFIEKRNDCLKLANLINSVYINGPGTEVETHTDFLITTYNSSQINVQDVKIVTGGGNVSKFAFLASEAGPTSEEFFDDVNEQLDPDPDWYKVCFDDIGANGCVSGSAGWMESKINDTLADLMDNLDEYNTIYLEDATIQYTTNYIEKLENWTSKGNVLILSEHVMCRESTGNFDNTSYRCDVPDGANGDNDDWNIFDISLHQRGRAWGWNGNKNNRYNALVNDTHEAFNLQLGEQISFEERSYINVSNSSNLLSNFKTIAKFREDKQQLGDSVGQSAITLWDYGDGKIIYFSDFQAKYVNLYPGTEFSETLLDLISIAYNLITRPEEGGGFTCHFSAFSSYQQVTGDIVIKNRDNYIFIDNVNST